MLKFHIFKVGGMTWIPPDWFLYWIFSDWCQCVPTEMESGRDDFEEIFWTGGNIYRDWKRPIRPVLMIDHHFMAGFLKSIVTRDPSRNRLANLRGNVVSECGNCVLSQWGEGGMGWHLWNWKKVLLSLLALCQVGGGDSWLPRTLSLRTSLDDVIINVSRIIAIKN